MAFTLYGCSHKIVPPGEESNPKGEIVLRGQEIFMRSCDRCHPGGMAGLGPAIINKPLPGFMIKFQVRHGLGAMPSFKNMKKADLNDLVAYIKSR